MAEYVGTAIDSVLDSDFEPLEVIVVNDGSRDGTDKVVSRYTSPSHEKYDARVRCASQPNRGKAAAVNHGLSMATGAYVAILDADDELPPDSLSRRYAQRRDEEGRKYDLVIGGFEVFDGDRTYGRRFPPPEASTEELRRGFFLRWKTPFHPNGCLIARDLIERTGPMDERMLRAMDTDYAVRLLDHAERIAIVPSIVYRYRKHREAYWRRLGLRLQTARYRLRLIWKNCRGWRKGVALPFGLAMDAGKLVYELLLGNYKQ